MALCRICCAVCFFPSHKIAEARKLDFVLSHTSHWLFTPHSDLRVMSVVGWSLKTLYPEPSLSRMTCMLGWTLLASCYTFQGSNPKSGHYSVGKDMFSSFMFRVLSSV